MLCLCFLEVPILTKFVSFSQQSFLIFTISIDKMILKNVKRSFLYYETLAKE